MSTNEQQWFDFEPSAPVATEVEPAPLPVAAPLAEAFLPETGEEVEVRRSPKATRYRLSVGCDGAAVLTIPMRGSERQARQLLESQRDWLDRTRSRLSQLLRSAAVWTLGTSVLWRGEWRAIERTPDAAAHVALGEERLRVSRHEGDLRPTLESHSPCGAH